MEISVLGALSAVGLLIGFLIILFSHDMPVVFALQNDMVACLRNH